MTNVWLGFSNCLDLNFVLVAATLNAWIFFCLLAVLLILFILLCRVHLTQWGLLQLKAAKVWLKRLEAKRV